MEFSSVFENIIKSFINLVSGKQDVSKFSINIKPKNKLYAMFIIIIVIITILGIQSTKKKIKPKLKEKLQKELGYLLLLFIIFFGLILYLSLLSLSGNSLSNIQYNGISIILFFFICYTLYKKIAYYLLLNIGKKKQNKLTKLIFMPIVITGIFLILFITNQCFDILSRIDYIGKFFKFIKINSEMKNVFDYCIYYLIIELIFIFIYCSYIYLNLKDTQLIKFFCSNTETNKLNTKCFDVILNDISENALIFKLFYLIILIINITHS
jgi:hypothetical protein